MEDRSGQTLAYRLPDLTLVIGGGSSGKTKLAERLIQNSKGNPVYVATAQPHDDEMRQKIELHRKSRGCSWKTIEAPFDIASALAECTGSDSVMIDCATIWLSNHVCADLETTAALDSLLKAIERADFPVVIVSNEIGLGGIAENSLTRLFSQLQGELNQQLAVCADLVIAVHAGLPLVLKGVAPQWV